MKLSLLEASVTEKVLKVNMLLLQVSGTATKSSKLTKKAGFAKPPSGKSGAQRRFRRPYIAIHPGLKLNQLLRLISTDCQQRLLSINCSC